MSAAVAAILEGMPGPADLRMHHAGGRCVITAGTVVLFDYEAGDIAMRNMALAALRQLEFAGRAVAAVLGLSEAYVATLHNAARREGLGGADRAAAAGPPGTVTAAQWQRARQWRAQEVSDTEIGRRLGVAHTTISRRLGPRGQARPGTASPAGRLRNPCSPSPGSPLLSPRPEAGAGAAPEAEAGAGAADGAGPAWQGLAAGRWAGGGGWCPREVFRSRYAGAMLLHGFFARADADAVLAGAAAGLGRAAGRRMRRCYRR